MDRAEIFTDSSLHTEDWDRKIWARFDDSELSAELVERSPQWTAWQIECLSDFHWMFGACVDYEPRHLSSIRRFRSIGRIGGAIAGLGPCSREVYPIVCAPYALYCWFFKTWWRMWRCLVHIQVLSKRCRLGVFCSLSEFITDALPYDTITWLEIQVTRNNFIIYWNLEIKQNDGVQNYSCTVNIELCVHLTKKISKIVNGLHRIVDSVPIGCPNRWIRKPYKVQNCWDVVNIAFGVHLTGNFTSCQRIDLNRQNRRTPIRHCSNPNRVKLVLVYLV